MPQKNIDVHGSAPDKHKFALLLIDVINDFDFPEADELLKYARPMARNLLRLKRRAQKAGVPVVYINDNFGRWKSDFRRPIDAIANQRDSSASPAENEKDHAHHQEQKEQNFRDSRRRRSDAAESKYGCYECNY